jgi:chemotaxis signal transduction protein
MSAGTEDQEWDALRQRLGAAAASLARATATPEARREVLRARARMLARPRTDHADTGADATEALVFRAGRSGFALPLAHLVEVYRPAGLSPVPRAAVPVVAAAAWRGRVLTVLALGRGTVELAETARLLVVGDARRAAFALIADEVEDVRSIVRSELHAPTDEHAGGAGRLPRALGVTDDAIVVLDGEALLRWWRTGEGTSV